MKNTIRNIHFIGIGGAGMSGIAKILISLGYKISGSDIVYNSEIEYLSKIGANIKIGHNCKNIKDVDLIVISSAIQSKNPEILMASKLSIPVISRAFMLLQLMREKYSIAISGTHGKTTTTSLITSILIEACFDPTFIIGGNLSNLGLNARLGSGKFIVVEADESDASFLILSPIIEVITNIDSEHMSTYQFNLLNLQKAFIQFIQKLPFYGIAILCVDDIGIREILPFISKKIIKYGCSYDAEIRAINIHSDNKYTYFTVIRKNINSINIALNLSGIHNIQNSLAAIAVASYLKIPDINIQNALLKFQGVDRRFQCYGKILIANNMGSYTLIDDYGHHPTEIEATISTIKEKYKKQRIVIIFQPHRFSRTNNYFDKFVEVLSNINVLILTEVDSAGEVYIPKYTGKDLSEAIRMKGKVNPIFIENINKIPEILQSILLNGDIVITMGAGSISKLAPCLYKGLN